MRLGISEILDNVSKLQEDHDKINFLREHWSVPLGIVLRYALDPVIEWDLPEGEPPYNPTQSVESQGMLYAVAPKLWRMIKNDDAVLSIENGGVVWKRPSAVDLVSKYNTRQDRREKLFIEDLEAVDPADARLLVAIKDKKMPFDGVTRELVDAAFPGLIP